MASLPRVEGESWVIEIRAKKAAYNVVLSYFLDEVSTDIPLTVAPKLESYKGKPFSKMTDSDLALFLAKGDLAKPDPAKDLNGDSKVDYIDNYIFTANYFVQAAKGASSETPKKSQELPLKAKPVEATGKPTKK
jgi:hypothetical protein